MLDQCLWCHCGQIHAVNVYHSGIKRHPVPRRVQQKGSRNNNSAKLECTASRSQWHSDIESELYAEVNT